ncbi:MAG: sensor histidine kinase N-terminal domain-containing protein [Burkholderiales bacterium]|nr:sensor histidine kinase N-terminal domain-containing protein [Burkholderiales bacterium]
MAPDKTADLLARDDTADAAPRPGTQRARLSLFGEILDWLLVPVMLLWPVSIVLTYVSAQALSNPPYDRALADTAASLADRLRVRDGRLVADQPLPQREILSSDETDTMYFQVLGLRGEFIAGDPQLPLPYEYEPIQPNQVLLRSDLLNGAEVRIAYIRVTPPGFSAGDGREDVNLPLVQVAETLNKRAELANEIAKGVILPQFVVLPLAVTLIWFGLVRGLAPLADLAQRIGRRRPGDLSPIDPRAAPEEVAPLIRSINQLMQQLDESLKGQQRFIANAAHQLRTPLAGLKTQTELAMLQARDGGDPAELRESLRQMALSTERSVRMVNQLLALTRAERSGGEAAPPVLRRLALDELARERVRDWVGAAMKKRIDLGCDEAREDPVFVDGDPVLLAELIGNLIDNAIRYTPDGGVITVHVRTAENGAVLMVEDNGPGIPEHERELVFERFYRVLGSDPDGRNLDGSGLGLAIVREIAAKHRARVTVGTAPLGGALFTVTFPPSAPPSKGSE